MPRLSPFAAVLIFAVGLLLAFVSFFYFLARRRGFRGLADGQPSAGSSDLPPVARPLFRSAKGELFEALFSFQRQMQAQMAQLAQSCADQLEGIKRDTLGSFHHTIERSFALQFQPIARQMAEVRQELNGVNLLSSHVEALRRTLANAKARGVWGELQLGALLADMLSPGQYVKDFRPLKEPGDKESVEYAVKLPLGPQAGAVYLPIDAKFPQEDYIRLQEAFERGDLAVQKKSREALSLRLKLEAKKISAKYIAPPRTTDFAVMYLPTEGLYAEAARCLGALESASRLYRVTIAGPSTLTALLNSLQLGFRSFAVQQKTHEAHLLLGALQKDTALFCSELEESAASLGQIQEKLLKSARRCAKIAKRLQKIEEIDF